MISEMIMPVLREDGPIGSTGRSDAAVIPISKGASAQRAAAAARGSARSPKRCLLSFDITVFVSPANAQNRRSATCFLNTEWAQFAYVFLLGFGDKLTSRRREKAT